MQSQAELSVALPASDWGPPCRARFLVHTGEDRFGGMKLRLGDDEDPVLIRRSFIKFGRLAKAINAYGGGATQYSHVSGRGAVRVAEPKHLRGFRVNK